MAEGTWGGTWGQLVTDAERDLRAVLSYPLQSTLASDKAAEVVADNFEQVAASVLEVGSMVAFSQACL